MRKHKSNIKRSYLLKRKLYSFMLKYPIGVQLIYNFSSGNMQVQYYDN